VIHTAVTNNNFSDASVASTEADWMMRFGASVVYTSAPNRQ
jgi:hypothetical protein